MAQGQVIVRIPDQAAVPPAAATTIQPLGQPIGQPVGQSLGQPLSQAPAYQGKLPTVVLQTSLLDGQADSDTTKDPATAAGTDSAGAAAKPSAATQAGVPAPTPVTNSAQPPGASGTAAKPATWAPRVRAESETDAAAAPGSPRVRPTPGAAKPPLLARPALSQRTPPATRPAPLAPAAPDSAATQPGVIPIGAGSSGTLVLELDRGELIHLPRPAATVFVANPAIADVQVKSSTLIYVFAKKGGETTLIAVDGEDKLLLDKRVMVTFGHTRLREAIKELAPDRNINISSIGEQLVLDGQVASPVEAENIRRLAVGLVGDEKRVINRLTVAAPIQVNLRVRVAEMTKDITKQFGFNWSLVKNILPGESGPGVLFSLVNPNSGSINNFLQFTAHSGPYDINTLIDAMEDSNLIKILAEPNLTALSGQTANFLVGGEFPVPVPQDRDTITIDFKKFGVQLAFEPIVLSGNRINLHVRPEVSELTDQGSINLGGFTIPGLNTRRAETTVEVASGQSFAIAGLLRNDVTHQISKWPGLADIPILGTLFRSDKFQRKESELVIIVTPYIVDPVSPDKLALPTDGYRPPHDVDRIFYGAQWRKQELPGGSNAPQRPRLAGPAGFSVE